MKVILWIVGIVAALWYLSNKFTSPVSPSVLSGSATGATGLLGFGAASPAINVSEPAPPLPETFQAPAIGTRTPVIQNSGLPIARPIVTPIVRIISLPSTPSPIATYGMPHYRAY